MSNNDAKNEQKSSAFHGVLPFLLLTAAFPFWELMIRILSKSADPIDSDLFGILAVALGFGLLWALLIAVLPKIASKIVGSIVLVLFFILYGIEFCCDDFYGIYFGISFMTGMTGDVVNGFTATIGEVVFDRIPQILVLIAPVILWAVLLISKKTRSWQFEMTVKKGVPALCGALALLLAGTVISSTGEKKALYTYDFEPNSGVRRLGVLSAARLELQYSLLGKPEPELPEINSDEPLFTTYYSATSETTETTLAEPSDLDETLATETTETEGPTSTPTPYPYNVTDIDFESLYENETNNTIKNMHLYFGNLVPSKQNEYTGIFEGKNLILITAEGFCPYAIDKDYTPTLYRLSHESFIFTDFYQPNWHLSTTGGEYAVMTGQIPQWIGSSNSFYASSKIEMPLGLGHIFGDMGYSVPAWHNGAYDFYDRNKTHPNLGYEFSAIDHGLDLPTRTWPASDKEMFEATCNSYIDEYVKTGKNFHAYYMTVSGHCNYTWGANAMSKRYKESAIEAFPDSSMQVQAYKACNKDLDLGLEYLISRLEKAGIADDTVIVMAADHYPYGIANKGTDYYKELSGIDDNEQCISRYRNSLILWCGSMTDAKVITTPCMTCDIVPTILNMFGIEYDSRLFAGHDIFDTDYDPAVCSNSMPLVILPMNSGNSWITAAGSYDCKTKEFKPNSDVTVGEDYVDNVNALVKDKWRYSGMMIQYGYFEKVLGSEE